MLKIITIIIVLILCVFTALFTINVNSLDNAVGGVTAGVFEMSIEIREEYEDIDMIHINNDKFCGYFEEEFYNNLGFYQGTVKIEYYFYNVLTLDSCRDGSTCNGVQIKLTMESFYMFNHSKIYRYEVRSNGD